MSWPNTDVCDTCEKPPAKDQSVLLWKDVLTCGWDVTATNVAPGSSVYNSASCNSGQKFCTNGSTSLVFSGPNLQLVDNIIIWGHDLDGAVVSVSPYGPVDGDVLVGGQPGACFDNCPPPVVMDLVIPPINSEVSQVTVDIQSTAPLCIDRIFVGQKLPVGIGADFENPHCGSDRETDFKRSSCGILATSTKRVMVPLSIQLPCVPVEWINDIYRDYLRWAHKNGFWFRWSINNAPNDVFVGHLDGPQPGGSFVDRRKCFKDLQINASGFITQPDCKRAA